MKGCTSLQDGVECELTCRFRARQCNRAQGDAGKTWISQGPKLGDYKALLIDLQGVKPLYSKALEVQLSPKAVARPRLKNAMTGGYHELPPGAHLAATYVLPEKVREAELIVTHAPGGEGTGCYITLTVGDKTLAGRYAPPRLTEGRLKEESWNLTPGLEKFPVVEGKRTIKLFLYNNQDAGSRAPYNLASIELHYRAFE